MHTVNADPASAGVNGSGVSVGPSMGWGVQAAPPSGLDVEIVIPVYNEERALAASIHRLHRFLESRLPFSWQITIADNASTDITPEIARALAAELDRVRVLRLERRVAVGRCGRRGRRAARASLRTWTSICRPTCTRCCRCSRRCVSGHSEVAIGSRLARGSRVARGPKREFISRSYNRLLHLALRARFTDAQCGFKAVRADVLPELLEAVRDESWFFDTELLIAAQRRGMRIHEVPVDWVDDPDSRVDIVSTALADLRGVARLGA